MYFELYKVRRKPASILDTSPAQLTPEGFQRLLVYAMEAAEREDLQKIWKTAITLPSGNSAEYRSLGAPFPMHSILQDLCDGRLHLRSQLHAAFASTDSGFVGLARLEAKSQGAQPAYSLDVYTFLQPAADVATAGTGETIKKLVLVYREQVQGAVPQTEKIEAADLWNDPCLWCEFGGNSAETNKTWRKDTQMVPVQLEHIYQLMHITAVAEIRLLAGMQVRELLQRARRCATAAERVKLLSDARFCKVRTPCCFVCCV